MEEPNEKDQREGRKITDRVQSGLTSDDPDLIDDVV